IGTFITNIIWALLRRRTTWRTRRLSETKPARSAKRPARATSVLAFALKKSALVRLSAASKMVCGVHMDAVIKLNITPLTSIGGVGGDVNGQPPAWAQRRPAVLGLQRRRGEYDG